MKYIFFKEILSSIFANFRCQCGVHAEETSLFMKNISAGSMELEYICPKCQVKSIISAKMGEFQNDFLKTEKGKEMLKKAFSQKSQTPQEGGISSEEIIKIENLLSKNTTVTDLINGE